jgi:hypothetical protein
MVNIPRTVVFLMSDSLQMPSSMAQSRRLLSAVLATPARVLIEARPLSTPLLIVDL